MTPFSEQFPEYCQPTSDQFEALWDECIFVFDTNVLLLCLKLSDDFVNAFFSILDCLKGRIFVPHQVAFEFMRNARPTRIKLETEPVKLRDDLMERVSAVLHPLLDIANLKNAIDEHFFYLLNSDGHKGELDRLFAARLASLADFLSLSVGTKFSPDEHTKLEAEAKSRFASKTPPGFKDEKKANSTSQNPYGDFFIWRQIIKLAKEKNVPIIFVTQDNKEDWWWKESGRSLGPLPELRREFTSEVPEKIFHMYNIPSFMEHASKKFLAREVDASALREFERFKKLEIRRQEASDREKLASEEVPDGTAVSDRAAE